MNRHNSPNSDSTYRCPFQCTNCNQPSHIHPYISLSIHTISAHCPAPYLQIHSNPKNAHRPHWHTALDSPNTSVCHADSMHISLSHYELPLTLALTITLRSVQ